MKIVRERLESEELRSGLIKTYFSRHAEYRDNKDKLLAVHYPAFDTLEVIGYPAEKMLKVVIDEATEFQKMWKQRDDVQKAVYQQSKSRGEFEGTFEDYQKMLEEMVLGLRSESID